MQQKRSHIPHKSTIAPFVTNFRIIPHKHPLCRRMLIAMMSVEE